MMGCKNSKVDQSATYHVTTEAPPPPETDERLPLTTRDVFRLRKSWKGVWRRMEETGVELLVR